VLAARGWRCLGRGVRERGGTTVQARRARAFERTCSRRQERQRFSDVRQLVLGRRIPVRERHCLLCSCRACHACLDFRHDFNPLPWQCWRRPSLRRRTVRIAARKIPADRHCVADRPALRSVVPVDVRVKCRGLPVVEDAVRPFTVRPWMPPMLCHNAAEVSLRPAGSLVS
jgi:hypothetical protein